MKRATALLFAAVLAGCGSDSGSNETETGQPGVRSAAKAATADAAIDGRTGTPNEDRVATLGLLNKRNNLTQDLVLKTGESRRIGNVIVKLESCERTAPWETVPEEGAFVQVFVNEQPVGSDDENWRTVFSGWLFRNSPSLNVVQHPVYDVWVKKCDMKFPGEEEAPTASASAKSAAKPSGNDSGASASE